MIKEKKDDRRKTTRAEQKEFNALWKDVLIACETIVFGRGDSRTKFAEIMGGQENVDRYYQMRKEIKVDTKV